MSNNPNKWLRHSIGIRRKVKHYKWLKKKLKEDGLVLEVLKIHYSNKSKIGTVVLSIVGAVALSVTSILIVYHMEGERDRAQRKDEYKLQAKNIQGELLLKVMDANDLKSTKSYIAFLMTMNLLPDPDSALNRLNVDSTLNGPVNPSDLYHMLGSGHGIGEVYKDVATNVQVQITRCYSTGQVDLIITRPYYQPESKSHKGVYLPVSYKYELPLSEYVVTVLQGDNDSTYQTLIVRTR